MHNYVKKEMPMAQLHQSYGGANKASEAYLSSLELMVWVTPQILATLLWYNEGLITYS